MIDRYDYSDGRLSHELAVAELRINSTVPSPRLSKDPKGAWWLSFLAGLRPAPTRPLGGTVRVVDVFCGVGGLATGFAQVCAELGVTLLSEFAIDQDEEATVVYAANHASRGRLAESVTRLIDFSVRRSAAGAKFLYPPAVVDGRLGAAATGAHLVLAGPPCQGHSNLNNRTRRSDPRNSLYLTVPALTVAIGAPMCVIENVPAVTNDTEGVVTTAQRLFESEGYSVTTAVLSASGMGWPQTRRRHFLVARRDRAPVPLTLIAQLLKDEPRSLWWAIGDFEDVVGGDVLLDPTDLSEENQARVDWLFANDAYDLALPERPQSHRGGTTYTAVYGRLKKDEPAPTITTGFMTPGRGRFTHPTRRRVLTAREAARLQGLPDNYIFAPNPIKPPSRSQLAKWIGDAVPMPLGYAAALSVLGEGLPDV